MVKKIKMIDLTLINTKERSVYGFGTHRLGESKAYPESVALSLLNDLSYWQRTEQIKAKELEDNE